jgi:formylglycine-generating enzyme required for sulfatase activity
MARVFISHATPDRSFVEREIIPLLEKHGIQTWYARTDIQGASEWERAILNGLRSCDQLLVVMSPRSARSKWVKREVDWAFAKERPVVPVMLEDCDPDDFHFGLAAIQFVDFRGGTQAGRQRLLDVFRGGQSRSEKAELQPIADRSPRQSEPPKQLTNSLGMKFVLVPKGTFWMGGGGGKPGDFQVQIPQDFYLGVYPVTQGQWEAVMGSNPSWFSRSGGGWFSRSGGGKDKVKDISDADLKLFPVEQVSWEDAQEFIRKLNEREKTVSGWLYRLPTEEEWEYACRGGACSKDDCSFDFYFDRPTNDLSSTQANFDGRSPAGSTAKGPYLERTTKVGSYPPNRLGICDLHGNVWEWTDSVEGSDRVYRGGCWDSRGSRCRAARRFWYAPSNRHHFLGFRLALSPSGTRDG